MSTHQDARLETDTLPFGHGAEWVRVDVHLHTQADKEFRYAGDPDFYNSAYVGALKQAGICLGVITNHNKFDLAEFKALRSTARKQGIGLLPGVELSIGDGSKGVHALVVFSDDWLADGKDYINPMLALMFKGQVPEQYEQENGRSCMGIIQTIETLDSYGRDYFLVFAHVEAPSGLWNEVAGGRLTEFGENPAFRRRTLGFQKVRTHDEGGKGKVSRTQVRQWLQSWYPAELEGCDAKGVEGIGHGRAGYVKLGELSFGALKFALTDPGGRVRSQPPVRASSFIRSVHFEGGILNGQTLRFSPGLNTLIGIRGSGKSSVLEALRYVLDIPRGDKAQDIRYKDELIRHLLGSGGKITLTAHDTFGQVFTVSRIFREPPNVYLNAQLQPGVSIRETVLRRPIYFGQKDLSSTGEGFETDLIEKLVGEKLVALRGQIAVQRQRVQDAAERYLKLGAVAEQKRDYQAQLEDASFRLQQFERYGLAEKLQKRLGFEQDASALKRMRKLLGSFMTDLDVLLAEHEDDLRNATAYVSAQNPDFFTDYYARYAAALALLDEIKRIGRDAKVLAGGLDEKQKAFETARQNLQEEFAQVERQLVEELKQDGVTAIAPDDFLQQQKRQVKARQMIDALSRQEGQQQAIQDALLRDIDQLNDLWRQEFQAIKVELDRVNANHAALQIEAEFKGDHESAIRYLQELFRGSNLREAALRSVMDGTADFGSIFRELDLLSLKAGSMSATFHSQFRKNLADLVSWQVPNQFVIRYRGKELKHHSLGQRASALILYVLSQQQNDVIIIDQPEDDLDNQTIYEDVIKLIRQMKLEIQFIFATHNANFPVLGDAEQVLACHYQDENIAVEAGSIDARPIQDAIIRIMEGGEEAFNKRKEVYLQWKPQNSSN